MTKKGKHGLMSMLAMLMAVIMVLGICPLGVFAAGTETGNSSTTVIGDVNGDGNVDAKDVALLLKALCGVSVDKVSDEIKDYNKDSEVNILDAIAILKKNSEGDTETTTQELSEVSLYLLGDSTMCSFNDNYYYPRYGYGTKMSKYFDEKVNVVNLAESGRSSKSYVTDSAANYSTYKNGIKKGDYVIIAFGHNDEKLEAERYTNPNTGLDDPTSFQSVIYNNYVKPALDVGATPIICTPIVRRTTGTFSASQLHNTTGTSAVVDGVTLTGGDYVAAGKALAEAYNLTCIDMTELTKNLYTELTPDETINLHAWTSKSSSSVDNTHLNVYGADVVAYLCTQAIKNSTSTLSARVLDGAVMPDKAETLVPNPDYKEAEYTAPQASTKWSDVGSWTGTVFGDVGGASKINATNFNLSAAETGSTDAMNIRAGVFTSDTEATGYGKLSSTAEGIAMYYRAVPSNKNFTITAKATINKLVTHDQVSFGLMARDAVWTDNYTKDSLGDYVAAGSLYATKAASGSMWANFCRKSGTLTKGLNSTKTEAYKPGDVVELKISKNDDGYACTIDGQSVSAGFDFQLTAIDSDYVYVGPYVARAADVTFSDVTLTIND